MRVGRHLRQRNLNAALIEEVVGVDALGRDSHDKRKNLCNPVLEMSHGAHRRRSPQHRLAAFRAAVVPSHRTVRSEIFLRAWEIKTCFTYSKGLKTQCV